MNEKIKAHKRIMSDNKPPMTVWLDDESCHALDCCLRGTCEDHEGDTYRVGPYVHLDQFLEEAKKMVDEGHEAWAVKCPAGQFAYTGTQDECSRKCADLNGKPIRRFYMPTEADSLDYGVSSCDKVRYHMHHLYMGDHSELWIVGIDQASGNEISRYPASRVTCIEWEVPNE